MCVNFRYYIFSFLASMLLFMALSPLMMLGVVEAAIISCIVFQSFTIIILSQLRKKCNPVYLLIAILVGNSIIELSIRACYFEATMLSFPVSIGEKLSIIAGYLVYRLIRRTKMS